MDLVLAALAFIATGATVGALIAAAGTLISDSPFAPDLKDAVRGGAITGAAVCVILVTLIAGLAVTVILLPS